MRIYGLILPVIALAAGAAFAAAPPVKATGAPIDITADRLEVFQEENRAVFTGSVVAIQGDTKLTSEKMTVHYRSSEEKKEEKSSDSIRRIDVEQNVFLSTPAETASGLSGVYDVEHHEIRLNGDVVLTKDKNTLKGDYLTYDLNTGKSVLTTGDGKAADGGKEKKRVRALFMPEGVKEGQKKP